jgi:uncharacterized protein YoxC
MNKKTTTIVIAILLAILIIVGINAMQPRQETLGDKVDATVESVQDRVDGNNSVEEAVEEVQDEIDDATTGN